MKKFKYCLWGIFFPILQATAQPQPISPAADDYIEIKGRVLNEQGDALGGASISVKNGKKTTITNENGQFEIRNITPNSVLVISYTGYQQKETTITRQTYLDIRLISANNVLDDIKVIAYGTTTQRFNTGNVTKVKGNDINKQPVSDPLAALEGRVPGMFIQQGSGAPGTTFYVQIRGQNSIANGNDPLYLVDGVPFTSTTLSNSAFIGGAGAYTSPLNSLNPSDIESIEILKDADATAIYGSRGANGVIIITTKKGKEGPTKLEVNVYTGTGKVTRRMNLMNTQQYLQMRHEAFKNDSEVPGTTNTDYDLRTWDTTRYTDWQKVFIGGTSKITDVQTSITGGNATTQFIMGSGYRKETTVFPGNFADQKGSVQLNVTHASTNQKFHMQASANYVNDNSQMPTVDFTNNITLAPNAPTLYDLTGNLNWENSTWTNPFATLLQSHRAITDNIIGHLNLSYEVLHNLQLKCSSGYNSIEMNEFIKTPLTSYTPAYSRFPSLRKGDFANNSQKTWVIEPQINCQTSIGSGQLKVLFGSTFQQNTQSILSQTGSGYSSDALIENLQAASTIVINQVNKIMYRYNAVFFRINYNWKEKYLIDITGRRDGSSRFGSGKEFGNFGAVGAGWIFSKETFIQNNIPFLSFGKLRASYGSTGNDQISDYQYLSTYSPYSIAYQGLTGLYPTRIANPYYGWELVKKAEAGLEFGILRDRVLLTANYYNNRTNNQLVGYSLPNITGFSSITANLPAVIQNSGTELELNTINIKRNNFTWTSSFNISFPRNKLIHYPNLEGSSYANLYMIGKSLFIRKLYHFTGVNPQTGLYTFQDVNKDGQITYPEDIVGNKQVSQSYFGGLDNTFNYKQWKLDIFFQFVKQTGYNYLYLFGMPGAFGDSPNQPTFIFSRWRNAGENTGIQKFSQDYSSPAYSAFYNARSSDYYISDASFIRLKNLSLSYQLPANLGQRMHLQNARIYLHCQNLFTITNYLGLDPETKVLTLPPLRMVTIGIQLTL